MHRHTVAGQDLVIVEREVRRSARFRGGVRDWKLEPERRQSILRVSLLRGRRHAGRKGRAHGPRECKQSHKRQRDVSFEFRIPRAKSQLRRHTEEGRCTRLDEPDVQLDLSFSNSIKDGDMPPTCAVVVLLDRSSGGVACTVTNTDAVEHRSQFVCARLDWCGHGCVHQTRSRTCA